MKIKSRLLSAFVLMGVIPAITVSLLVGSIAYNLGREAIEQKVSANLQSQRQIKKTEIEHYLHQLQALMISQARSYWMKDAANDFSSAFRERASSDFNDDFSKLAEYYKDQFGSEYLKANGRASEFDKIWGQLGQSAKVLQRTYIANNSSPLGSKDKLDGAGDGTWYDEIHQKNHPTLRALLQAFKLYDVFIVEPESGLVVYSTYKELDFATSLDKGPYRTSGLARTYQQAKALKEGEIALVDFSDYEPSYNAAAAFMGTPIFSQARLSGILIFQMPLDQINTLMTYGGRWTESGLGASGETYLVGGDGLLKSASRFQLEDPQGFVKALTSSGAAPALTDYFDRGGAATGKLPIKTESTRLALEGNSGLLTQTDYRGERVVSAYAPLDIAGVDWVILSEQDVAEAFHAVELLKSEVFFWSMMICLMCILAAAVIGWSIARGVATPIEAISEQVQKISTEQDFTRTIDAAGDYEMQSLGQAINHLIERLRINFQTIQQTAEGVRSSAVSLNDSMVEVMAMISDQNDRCHQQASSATEMEQTIQEVAKNAALTSEKTAEASDIAVQTDRQITSSVGGFSALSTEMDGVTEVVESVDRGTKEIGGVLDVIRGIADQTNLLALNAAIEAARAGETGRGFAVVADEVRTLAGRTAEATTEINDMINRLQSSSQSAVQSMASGAANLATNLATIETVQQSVAAEASIISEISGMNIQVATAAEEQAAVAVEINRNASKIHESASLTSERVLDLSEMSRELGALSDGLREIVETYRV